MLSLSTTLVVLTLLCEPSRAIMQSGAPLSIGTLDKNPAQAFYDLANRTGCLDEAGDRWTSSIMSYFTSRAMRRMDPQSVLACLRRLNANDLLRVRQSGISSLSPMVSKRDDQDFVGGETHKIVVNKCKQSRKKMPCVKTSNC